MPGLNFDYTKFLREQNEKYVKKYGNEPIKSIPNPQPIAGFGGHVPYYRNSLHELRVVRSLVRCINSPMKPTTATGYRSKSRQFYSAEEDEPKPTVTPKNKNETKPLSPTPPGRIRSAPAALSRERPPEEKENDKSLLTSPKPSHISMLAAGSSAMLKHDTPRPNTAQVQGIHDRPQARHGSRTSAPATPLSSARSSSKSVTPLRLPTPVTTKHPTGYPQTLYGASYWYAWPGDTPRTSESKRSKRPDSYDRDRKLTRQDGVIYHRHEGMVPKYMGYVPTYKFRHGSTFGVLTVNATSQSVANNMTLRAK